MTVLRRDCVSSRGAAVIVGLLSLIGTIIAMVPVGIWIRWYRTQGNASNMALGLSDLCVEMFLLFHACSSILMMFGVLKGKPGLMFPWLGISVTAITISISVSFAIVMNYILSTSWRRDLNDFAATLGVAIIITAVATLLCAIVYDHYKQLVSGKPAQSSRPYTLNETVFKTPLTYHKV